MVSRELDLPDFYLWPFFDFEHQNHRIARGDALVLRRDLGKLPPVFSQQFLQYHFRFFDLRRIELAFHAQPDFAFLEAVENVRFRNRVISVIADAPDLRPLFDLEDDDFPVGFLGRILDPQFYVFKELRVPQRLKIAPQGLFVVHIAVAGENPRS